MNCRPLTAKEVRALYAHHLSRDFPPAERKPLAAILSLLRRGRYLCLGGFAGEELRAYAFFTRVPEGPCWLLDYYAVCQGGRGQGAGSAFWRQLPGHLDGCQGLLIEVEDPDTAPTAQERETRRRRIRFYLKNGARGTGCRCRLFGVEYRILFFPVARDFPDREIPALLDAVYRATIPGPVYRRQVAFPPAGE